jgi:hypothetical protein
VSNRIISISMRAWPIQFWMLAISLSGLPKVALDRALAQRFECPLGHAGSAQAVVDAAGPQARLADRQPLTFALEDVRGRRDSHRREPGNARGLRAG